MVKVLHENLGMISNFPMFVDPLEIFVISLLCYARCLGYLLCTMFPSLVFCNIMLNSMFIPYLRWKKCLV